MLGGNHLLALLGSSNCPSLLDLPWLLNNLLLSNCLSLLDLWLALLGDHFCLSNLLLAWLLYYNLLPTLLSGDDLLSTLGDNLLTTLRDHFSLLHLYLWLALHLYCLRLDNLHLTLLGDHLLLGDLLWLLYNLLGCNSLLSTLLCGCCDDLLAILLGNHSLLLHVWLLDNNLTALLDNLTMLV